jgi:LmbE family N-acetylglucosaminyl deacetylase
MRFDPMRRICLTLLVALLLGPVGLAAQALDGTGAVATGLLLRQMDGVKRVLMIGAHPDDEDTSFLTVMARRYGAETAYLALTRGDGGQNLIGPELWEGLGIIRTGELEAARALDGGRQFFTRAFDYGFSKSAEEALTLWPREELLEDVVWVVRSFRPHVIVSVFSGTPRDGHGQHQAAGIMAREAFAAAGDPSRFPTQLELGVEAWAPAKILQRSRRFGPGGDSGPADGEILVSTGDFDPLLGRSNFQLSMESRSQHRSQGMGAAQPTGPRSTGVLFVDGRVPEAGVDVFSGVDTTLVGLTNGLPTSSGEATRQHLEAYRASVRSARERFGLDPSVVVEDLTKALAHLRQALATAGDGADSELRQALAQKELVATEALLAASGIVFDVRATDDIVVPGQSVEVSATLWNGGASRLTAPEVQLAPARGWSVRQVSAEGLSGDGSVEPGTLAAWRFEVGIPADAEVSRLYFLREVRDGARYRWPDEPAFWGRPSDAPFPGAT